MMGLTPFVSLDSGSRYSAASPMPGIGSCKITPSSGSRASFQGRAAERTNRIGMASFPAQTNARRAEVDVLGLVFLVQAPH